MTQPDTILQLGNSTIQHGPLNNRVYILTLDREDLPQIVDQVYELGREHGYSKLFAKVPADEVRHFSARGFIDEARVPGMYQGSSAGYFMSKYLDAARAIPADAAQITTVLDCADKKQNAPSPPCSQPIQRLSPDDAPALAKLYATVFQSYPFPVDNPDFICDSMQKDVVFFGAFNKKELVAAASAEMNTHWGCVEMTDFATLPETRGQGVASALLTHMEHAMKSYPMQTAYTIARAESFGMNIVFSRGGYTFGGTLHNNTQIGGKLESMNVWYKALTRRQTS